MKSLTLYIFTLCLMAFSANISYALSEAEIEQMHKYSSLYKAADSALNRVYKDAMTYLKGEEKSRLITNQKKWVAIGRNEAVDKLLSQGYEIDCAYALATLEQACKISYQVYTENLSEAEIANGSVKTEEAHCEMAVSHPLLGAIFYPEALPSYCEKDK